MAVKKLFGRNRRNCYTDDFKGYLAQQNIFLSFSILRPDFLKFMSCHKNKAGLRRRCQTSNQWVTSNPLLWPASCQSKINDLQKKGPTIKFGQKISYFESIDFEETQSSLFWGVKNSPSLAVAAQNVSLFKFAK